MYTLFLLSLVALVSWCFAQEIRLNAHHVEGYMPHRYTQKGAQDIIAPLSHGLIYTIRIGVGSPPQEQELLLDTGSSDMVIFDQESNQCRQSQWGCGGGFTPSSSRTFQSTASSFEIGYGNQPSTARGLLMSDRVEIGSASFRQQIALVDHALLDFDSTGVFGLNHRNKQQVARKHSTPLENIPGQNMFSLHFGSRKTSGGATIAFNKIDSSKFTGDLKYVPFVQKEDYVVTLTNINGISEEPIDVLLDSGSIGLMIEDDVADRMAAAISSEATYDASLPAYRVPCGLQGDFKFSFGSSEVSVHFDEVIREIDENQCVADIVRESTYGIGNILGLAFFSSVYSVFDADAGKVGLAQAAQPQKPIQQLPSAAPVAEDPFKLPSADYAQIAFALAGSSL